MITITDIAQKAGVSRTTVSYVLNARSKQERISDETRLRVLAAASELGYSRNELARAVTTGQSRTLGFWVMESHHEPVARVLAGAMKEADANDYFIKMLGFDSPAPSSQIIERCMAWRVSGILAIHANEAALEAVYAPIEKSGIPLVLVDSSATINTIHVTSDQKQGVRDVVSYLAEVGHQKIAFIAGHRDEKQTTVSSRRVAAYCETMRELGLHRHENVQYGFWNEEETRRVVQKLLKLPLDSPQRPTALACWSDYTAMVAIRTATEMGLRVPQDISISGFDDISVAPLTNPPLTTVAQPFEEMGRRAVRYLLEPDKTHTAPHEDALPTRLILRDSTAPPARNSPLKA